MTDYTQPHPATAAPDARREERKIIFASSLGTVFEWYDFFLYGALAAVISKQFFAGVNDTTAFIFALMAFAAGFLVRPFGALVFGRLGDMIGRKYTFLVTIVLMGVSTFAVGLLPSYASIGIAAPVILIVLRMLQGLALGGEYGGAATYVAEHAPANRRGHHTGWIQSTATLGLLLSLIVVMACRYVSGDQFEVWGWRLPFLLSIVLLGISTWIRLSLHESPAFLKMKAEGKTCKAPIRESFGSWQNLKVVLIALFSINAGQAVTFYTAQFYVLFFLTQILKMDPGQANSLMIVAVILGAPFFVICGWLSDRIGRKPILLTGLILATVLYFPLFKALSHYANPAIDSASAQAPITVMADPTTCTFQFDPVGKARFDSPCDKVKTFLVKAGLPYTSQAAPAGSDVVISVGDTRITGFDQAALASAVTAAGYPTKADPGQVNQVMVVAVIFALILIATMCYGPLAALMVELFPTRIRYTSMSLPYHIGNGWFGGLLPTVSFALVVYTGNIFYGLWYPVIVTAVSVIVSLTCLKETKDVDITRT
ncbi:MULTISPECIES: MFS transporter [unclassified Pseudomonas]|uniref:MFS transporter n=1 Tax=unclassified Pseudomonas TaxID=196821 RepID=UPI000BD0CD2D|nr:MULTISPECIES: MFS transporter [unclassified Pseudomonas]PVZ10558.1 putative MFS family arabinose efflux permease [Pseudomonas sp. URIL14HWK12:I12]PVZ21984.1 putative MFS family arabinose efflux permease [Pseudomonas sp. URIL14HWK12:I10]PVZ30933.1 putative MFS family arabinose efflux permease [Pseudomonas sp. URIL14HWK12:I11]SNZ17332.1 Predicted arabinose efflux permease, MFS family [Pseudomonas sp. URIL14HWK12:I9]